MARLVKSDVEGLVELAGVPQDDNGLAPRHLSETRHDMCDTLPSLCALLGQGEAYCRGEIFAIRLLWEL